MLKKLKKVLRKAWNSDFLYLVYQFSKPLMALLFLVGVLYLDHFLDARGCRYMVERSVEGVVP